MYELVFLSGTRAGEVVPVKSSLLAGRSPECSLEIPDPNASRQHARLIFDGTSLSIVDNRSANGTFVNERRINEPTRLKHDDIIRMGETRLRVQMRRTIANPTISSESSVFGFHDSEADLSQSIVLPMATLAGQSGLGDAADRRFAILLKAMNLSKDIDQLDRVLEGILEVMFELFPQVERGFLMLGNCVERLQPKAVRVRGGSPNPQETPRVSTSICRKALSERAAFLFNDSNPGDFDQGMSIVSLRIRSAMTVPLLVEQEILGLLQVDTTDRARAFTSRDLELAVAISQVASIALRNAQQLKRIENETRTRDNLCRFLPAPVAQQVIDGTLDLALGGKTYHGTVLFSDIVGFTRMSEEMPPEQVVETMNRYFERMVPCIRNEGGSIDKFIGDAIMAFWGVPIARGNSALQGCAAALAMQIALAGFNSAELAAGRRALGQGIGLNTGPVVAGNIGSPDALSYTLLGDTVNTASRIEHHAVREQVLVSQATWRELGGAGHGLRMPPISVRNKAEPLQLYSLRGLARDGGEIMLFLPVECERQRAWLIRRLADHSFVLLHPPALDLRGRVLTSALPEWPERNFGKVELLATMPAQNADGRLLRSQIRLSDPSLLGLLGPEPLVCALGWDALVR
ncbi:MAG: adenylate/guanylate cyclase domain-containing protein [Planctomycetota bacterium]|nr:FHA domain-containing protein [Planctomycetota bacterium]MDW8372602.1 adenylate/guanylate cyclase domain-containing protein [Planctomycetota bacterium]